MHYSRRNSFRAWERGRAVSFAHRHHMCPFNVRCVFSQF